MELMENLILKEKNICFLNRCTYQEAIVSLINTLGDEIKGKDQLIVDKVLERESIASTAIGKAIAIPHGRCAFLDNFYMVIGLCNDGLEWETLDNEPVKIICLLIGPEDKPREYLSYLSSITSILKEEDTRIKILNEYNKKKIVNIFRSC